MAMIETDKQNAKAAVISQASAELTQTTQVFDEYGQIREISIAGERPLTLYLNKREIVTLMTLGAEPEALVLGYLRNQGMVKAFSQIRAVQVDWDVEAAVVVGDEIGDELEEKLAHKTVTTGCGQGTQYGALMDDLESIQLPSFKVAQSDIYRLLKALNEYNETYRSAGAVHGCALCALNAESAKPDTEEENRAEVLAFSEDVGRHNAVDTLAGKQWLTSSPENPAPMVREQMVFYTTGRLTSEMVIKVARMGISVLLSRSGVTAMGLALAKQLGIMLIARAKGQHFMLYEGAERFDWDAPPPVRPKSPSRKKD